MNQCAVPREESQNRSKSSKKADSRSKETPVVLIKGGKSRAKEDKILNTPSSHNPTPKIKIHALRK